MLFRGQLTYYNLNIMKKLSLFILLIAATLTSCGSDDDSPGTTEANLIGKWQWTAASENGVAETLDQCDLQDTIEFQTGGTAVSIFFNSTNTNGQITCGDAQTENITWSLSGDQLSLTYTEGTISETDTATITISGTTLTVEYRDEETPGEITVYIETYTKV